jgi:hypothetical protein
VSHAEQYLLDTNVVSEPLKKRANEDVIRFFQTTDPSALHLSVLIIGELRKGVAARRSRDADGAARLASWVDGLERSYAERIIPIDSAIASLWGEWSAQRSRPVIDTLLAATAVSRQMVLVTRNIRDIADLPVQTLNPWGT